jgi:methionyl-tRNA formyltransferase
MFRNIVILAPQGQQQIALAALLRAHNPTLTLMPVTTLEELIAIDPLVWRHARLLAFTTGTIVPREILEALGYGAYNFHPGPPEYPGWAPAHFALYDGTTTFGATAHLMTEQVDAGPIVGTETFVFPDGTPLKQLEQMAYVSLAYLFWRLSKQMATQAEPVLALPISWAKNKSTRKKYETMCRLPLTISEHELTRRIRAFDDDFRGIHPTLTLHGVEFRASATKPVKLEKPMSSNISILKPRDVVTKGVAITRHISSILQSAS